jgi:hypothetical protein
MANDATASTAHEVAKGGSNQDSCIGGDAIFAGARRDARRFSTATPIINRIHGVHIVRREGCGMTAKCRRSVSSATDGPHPNTAQVYPSSGASAVKSNG